MWRSGTNSLFQPQRKCRLGKARSWRSNGISTEQVASLSQKKEWMGRQKAGAMSGITALTSPAHISRLSALLPIEIGRASCRKRVSQYVYIPVVAIALKKKTKRGLR